MQTNNRKLNHTWTWSFILILNITQCRVDVFIIIYSYLTTVSQPIKQRLQCPKPYFWLFELDIDNHTKTWKTRFKFKEGWVGCYFPFSKYHLLKTTPPKKKTCHLFFGKFLTFTCQFSGGSSLNRPSDRDLILRKIANWMSKNCKKTWHFFQTITKNCHFLSKNYQWQKNDNF